MKFMAKVASRGFIVGLVLWDANHILHKCYLRVTDVMALL